MRLLCILLVCLLAGCQTVPAPEPVVKTVQVLVPTLVRCNPQIPDRTYPDTDEARKMVPDIYQGTTLLLAGREIRTARIGELEAALAACKGSIDDR